MLKRKITFPLSMFMLGATGILILFDVVPMSPFSIIPAGIVAVLNIFAR